MMKTIVLLALIVLVAIAHSNRIDEFKGCFSTCRGQKNSFRFCVKFCKPATTNSTRIAKPVSVQKDAHGEKVLKQILGDDYAPFSDSEQSLDTLTPQSKMLWQKYKSVLLDFFRKGDQNTYPGLQLVMQPFAADWDMNMDVLNFLCNSIPWWAPNYEPSKRLLSTEYGDWLLNVKVPNQAQVDGNAFREIDNRLRDAEDKINQAELDCMDRYDQRYGTRRLTLQEPETFPNYQARYCLSMYRAIQDYDVVLAEYEQKQYALYGEHMMLVRAIAKYSTESRKGKFNFLSLGSMERFVQAAKEQRTNSFEIKITSKTVTTTEKTFTTSIGVSYSLQNNPFTLQDNPDAPNPTTPTTPTGDAGGKPFLSIGVNYSKSKYEFKTSTSELQLIVGAAGYKIFPVYPDRTWFSPEVLDKYKSYPLKRNKDYFSIRGTMPLYPKTLIIVVGPRLTMLVNQEDASKMETSSQLKANIEVAGLKFDFAKDAKIKKSQESANLFKVTIEGNSYEPQVLAVDNEILATGSRV